MGLSGYRFADVTAAYEIVTGLDHYHLIKGHMNIYKSWIMSS